MGCFRSLVDHSVPAFSVSSAMAGHSSLKTRRSLIAIAGLLIVLFAVAAHEAGDHWLFVGRVEKVVLRGGDPLAYWGAGYRRLADSA